MFLYKASLCRCERFKFVLAPISQGDGSLTITLVHEPNKPNDGLDTAGGEIDIQTTFSVTVQ